MYNNPFLYDGASVAKRSIFQGLKTINWGNFLGNAQKTLGVINQAIPIVYQVKPIIGNAKTILKIANGLKSSNNYDSPSFSNEQKETNNSNNSNSSKPVFFL